jgi:hypothetical protein
VVADVAGAVADGAPLVTDRVSRAGLFHGLGEIPPRDGNVCYRYRIDRGELESVFARADIVVEGEYTFPSVYQYAMTHTVLPRSGGRSALGDASTPARRDRRPVRRPGGERTHPGAVPGRLRRVIRRGAADRCAGAESRPARADPEPGRRVDGHDPAAQHDLPNADCRDGGRPPARAGRRVPVRHRCLRGQRASGGCDRGGRGAGPVPLGRLPRRRSVRLHEPRTGRLLPGVRRDAPRSGSANRRSTRSPARRARRSICAARTSDPRARRCAPAENRLDADLVGDVEKVAAAVGWGEEKGPVRAGAASRSAARGRRASGRARSAASRPTVAWSSWSGPGWARGRGRPSRRSPPRRSASSPSR